MAKATTKITLVAPDMSEPIPAAVSEAFIAEETETSGLQPFGGIHRMANDRIARKSQRAGIARQKFAQAIELGSDEKSLATEAEQVSAEGAKYLYEGQRDGDFTAAEISNILIEYFGAVPKSDGSPGKTPMGRGSDIRKRLVRLAAAYEYVSDENNPGNSYFAGLPREDVQGVLINYENDHRSLWETYGDFDAIKKEHASATPLALNEKGILKLLASLEDNNITALAFENEKLMTAYAGLYAQLAVVGAEYEALQQGK